MSEGKSLLIVESPAKARTISKYVGDRFLVKASLGHVKNLPESELGVDIEKGFRPRYVTIRGKQAVLKELKRLAREAEAVYVATDPDREGEAIAWHIAQELRAAQKPVYRVLFYEITRQAVQAALQEPGQINERLVHSQQARRVMDRLVGYLISPVLWKAIYRGLSAGRVQSVALRLICEREQEIGEFQPREYWSVLGRFALPGGHLWARLHRVGSEWIGPPSEKKGHRHLPDEATARREAESALQAGPYRVAHLERRHLKRQPPPPFTTSTLQQAASNRLGFTAARTMAIAQQLYEGIELEGGEPVGLITYMRTDSTRLSPEAVEAARAYIAEHFGLQYVPKQPRQYAARQHAQDAHEAIRPTDVRRDPESVKRFLSPDQYRLYELIWQRFVACQMVPAEFEQVSVDLESADGRYGFRATGSRVEFRGFLLVYGEHEAEKEPLEEGQEESPLPEGLAQGQSAQLEAVELKQHFTKPPPRYTEATLVKALEEKGIGRPSTYATILSTLRERGYVQMEGRKFVATELGLQVNDILVRHFPEFFDVSFTARMEADLDRIASGEADYETILRTFYYDHLLKALEATRAQLEEIRSRQIQQTSERCPKCGRPLVIRPGRYGRFYACSGFPACRYGRPVADSEEAIPTEKPCPECGAPLLLRRSRYGRFYSCSRYPDCRYKEPYVEESALLCPQCGQGRILERYTRRGRRFYGCTRYPECTFTSWDRPVAQSCPQCGHAFLVEKTSRQKTRWVCPACKAQREPEQTLSIENP
jgi:DNA topoisomerase-1